MDLLPLALKAVHDHTAQPVLGDAAIEQGWTDERVMWLLTAPRYDRYLNEGDQPSCRVQMKSLRRAGNLAARRRARPDRRWCRAVAAVLMFGAWTTGRWPGVENAWVEPKSWGDALRALYPDNLIGESVYANSPLVGMLRRGTATITGIDRAAPTITTDPPATFFGLNREVDPLRLAGVQLVGSGYESALDGSLAEEILRVDNTLSARERIAEATRRAREAVATPPAQRGALAEAWDREMAATARGIARVLDRALYPVPPRRRRS